MTEQPTNWVFAYGSLMWDPGFPVACAEPARVEGYSRSFCLRSTMYRGTPASPGLVLGLDPNPQAHCIGMALGVLARDWPETYAYLRDREMSNNSYDEMLLPARLRDGRRVEAVAYVMRRDHAHYCGGLSLAEQASIIALARGGRGPNADYLFNTVQHLAQIGVPDDSMEELSRRVRCLLEGGGQPGTP